MRNPELEFPRRIMSLSVPTLTSLRALALRTLICAGFPGCFWPFAAQDFCFLENTSAIDVDGKVYRDGSSYHRARGKGETTALRMPFGCAVYFIPADTKGFPKGKFEGSGEARVIAGYN